MAIRDRTNLKGYFTRGARPSQGNFHDLIDSFYHQQEDQVSQGGWMYRSLFNDLLPMTRNSERFDDDLVFHIPILPSASTLLNMRVVGKTLNGPVNMELKVRYVTDVEIPGLDLEIESNGEREYPDGIRTYNLFERDVVMRVEGNGIFDSGVLQTDLPLEHAGLRMLYLQLEKGQFRTDDANNYAFFGFEYA